VAVGVGEPGSQAHTGGLQIRIPGRGQIQLDMGAERGCKAVPKPRDRVCVVGDRAGGGESGVPDGERVNGHRGWTPRFGGWTAAGRLSRGVVVPAARMRRWRARSRVLAWWARTTAAA